jgi:TetR/AcrR family transcriptional regulator, transcriptional repressor of bet genes
MFLYNHCYVKKRHFDISIILTLFCKITVMPKKVDPIAQRQMIAEAAIRVINQNGIDGARLRDVGREANVTTGTIMHYYASKQDVLEAVLERILSRTVERVQRCNFEQQGLTVKTFINEAIYQLPVNEENRAEWRVWLAFCGAAVADRDLLKIHRRHYRKLVSRAMLLLHRLPKGALPATPFEEREPLRFDVGPNKVAVLAIPEQIQAQQSVKLSYPRQVHRCAEAMIAAIEGIGSRATLDPDRWPLWSQAEALIEVLTPLLENFVARASEEAKMHVRITRLAA